MKPFNLEAAKNGAAVCTRDGRDARIICWDAKGNYPIIALIKECDDMECTYSYNADGKFLMWREAGFDLMMKSEHHTGWINIYHWGDVPCGSTIYATKKEALNAIGQGCTIYVTTIYIEWDE